MISLGTEQLTSSSASDSSLSQTLDELRASRRLQKIVTSIESFFQIQLNRLQEVADECQRVAGKDASLQQMLAEFEEEKHQWKIACQQEVARLSVAGERLVEGWNELEVARRDYLDEQQM